MTNNPRQLNELRTKEWFTRKPIENPSETQVYIKGSYDRVSKCYPCTCFGDINKEIYLRPTAKVYTDFTF